MKKIVFVCSSQVSIPPERGGAIEEIVFEIAKEVKRKTKPFIVSRRNFSHPGIKCIKVNSKIRKNKIAAIFEDIFYGIKCVREIKDKKPDILHLNTTFTSLPIAIFMRGNNRPKLIYTSHSPSWTVPDNEIGTANRIFSGFEAFVMKRSDKVTAVSESMRKGIVKKAGISPKKVVTIPNFSKLDEFSPRYGKKWKRKNKITGNLILFVGKLTETKGVGYLIESIPRVVEKHPETTFAFVGGLEHEQRLTKNPWRTLVKNLGVEKNAIFLGNVSRKELPEIYAASDLFVLPTLREGMPLVILEAAASGLPIVTTKISGIPEIVDGNSAIFVRRKNSKALANAIIKIISEPGMAKRMGAEARKAAVKLRKEAVLEKYARLYKSICN